MLSLSISNALYGFDTLKHSSMPGIGIFVPISICRKEENKIKIDLLGSVTRFGEISPLWQNFNYLWKSFEGSFSNWQIFNLFWELFLLLGKCSMLQMAKCWANNLAIWSHWSLHVQIVTAWDWNCFRAGRNESIKKWILGHDERQKSLKNERRLFAEWHNITFRQISKPASLVNSCCSQKTACWRPVCY